jgi:DnaJ-class molecular chaperone
MITMAKDYYKILGVERSADEKEIKKAYRKLARQYHPDANKGANAEAKFKEINEAYQVLSDKEKRSLYDQFGADYDKVQAGGYPGANYGGGAQSGAQYDFRDIFNQARHGGGGQVYTEEVDASDLGDVFENLFGNFRGGNRGQGGAQGTRTGGGFNFRGARARGPQKGSDVEQPIDISLAESIRGTQRSLQLTIRDPSTGSEHHRNVTIKIPAGVHEGARVRAANQGAPGDNGGANGDLYLRIHIQPHPFWKREGDDIHIEVPITFGEAALGATIAVPTLNGEVQLKVPAGTQCGQIFRLSNRGVSHLKGGGHGDQYVKVKVMVPKNLGPREEELIREMSRLRDQNVRLELPRDLQ